ncbi:MAG: hypothetical protein PHI58_02020 [Candidatus Omnitrophica bacterium]|nr:hypothetical protein [Candidatus Omnitrophota bacterium]
MKILFLALAVLTLSCAPSYAQEGEERKVTEGNISYIDWVGSVIEVNNMTISVPPGMSIRKGNSGVIGLAELNMGDPVVITYYTSSSGENVATNITVQYYGDFAV